MHQTSIDLMKDFAERFVNQHNNILDVGSRSVNGSYRDLFPENQYIGIDITAGENVDIVVEPYKWDIKSNNFDIVISGQAFEHIEYFWLTMEEIKRVMIPGGYLCIIAPAEHSIHPNPLDCWRFLKDGMKALAKCVDLKVIEARTFKKPDCFVYNFDKTSKKRKKRHALGDSILIAQKIK